MEHETNTPGAAAAPQPAPYAAGTGSAPLLTQETEFACMSYRERLALKRSDPETYRRLREKQAER